MFRLLCALVLFGVALPPSAQAEQVIAARDIRSDIAVDDRGRAFLVTPNRGARVRSAAPGAPFGPWRALHSGGAVSAVVAADGRGVIVLQSRDRRVRVAPFSRRGTVGAPVVVSRGRRSDYAASAMARNGAAVVVWFRHREDGRWRLEAAVRDPGSTRFSPPQPLSAFVRRPCCTSVSVAISERGDTVATWTSTARPAVWVAQRRPGKRFSSQQRLADEASDTPVAAVGAGGAATVLYSVQRVPSRPGDGLQLHRAASAGAFGAAEPVNPGGGVTINAVAVTGSGHVLVAWIDPASGSVRVSEAGLAEPLIATAELGARVAPQRLAVAADDAGRAVVVWTERDANAPAYREQARAAVRAAGAPFGPSVALGPPWRSAEPKLARMVPGGGALVAWTGHRFDTGSAATAVSRLP